jgi:hypothetical protein
MSIKMEPGKFLSNIVLHQSTDLESVLQLRTTFSVVDKIASHSGWEYSLESGANITAESETVWTDWISKLEVSAANTPLPLAATNMIQAKAALTAKQFKNKGWLHYDAMKQLLPSKTRGSLAFYTRMPADNVALVRALPGPSQATTSQPTNYDEADAFEQEIVLDNIKSGTDNPNTIGTMPPPSITEPLLLFDPLQRPNFTPSTPGTSTIASSKWKASGDSGDNMRSLARPLHSTKSASESGKSIKSQHVAVPEAFQDMSKEIHNLTNSFDHATDVMHERTTQVVSLMHKRAAQAASRPIAAVVDPIPVRKQKAIIQLQKEGLEDHETVEIIKHFQADVSIADLYLVIEKESTRKLFLSTYLK